MVVVIGILNIILTTLFVLSTLNVFRHSYFLIKSFVQTKTDESERFRLDPTALKLLGISIAYIIASLFIGIGI